MATGVLERVQLEAGRLFVGRDSRVADEVGVRCFRYIDISRARGNALLGLPTSRFSQIVLAQTFGP